MLVLLTWFNFPEHHCYYEMGTKDENFFKYSSHVVNSQIGNISINKTNLVNKGITQHPCLRK